MTTIRKVLIPHYGDESILQIITTTLPSPPAQHIQIQVLYSGFSGADIAMRRGMYPFQRSAPLTPGYSLIGRVISVGPQTNTNGPTQYQPGDLVASLTVYDAQAERVNLPEKYLIPVPIPLPHLATPLDTYLPQATALILDWCTAWTMIKRVAKVRPGQRVFVHGMSGAVGYALLKLCLMVGASAVYGTASEKNHEAIRQAGGVPFVYTDKRWIEEMQKPLPRATSTPNTTTTTTTPTSICTNVPAGAGVHAVFDPLGFESFDESYSILTEEDGGGILVGYGGNRQILDGGVGTSQPATRSPLVSVGRLMLKNMNVFSRKKTRFYGISRDDKDFGENLTELLGFLREGKIEVPIRRIWELEEIQEAHRSWGKGVGVGSLLVRCTKEE